MICRIISTVAVIFLYVAVAWGQARPEVITSKTEKDLIPEGIAGDERTGLIYVSSIYRKKIIVTDQKGNTRNFIKEGQDGFLQGLGLKIDYKRNWIWALSNEKKGIVYYSGLQAFDLASGQLRQQHFMSDTLPHLLNDCVIFGDTIFITDSHGDRIYYYSIPEKHFELLYQGKAVAYPNGIAAGNGDDIYVATYSNGLVRLNVKSKNASAIPGYKDTAIIKGMDGIVFYKNSIVGIYNIGEKESDNCIIQYQLSENGDSILAEKVIDKGNTRFHTPTTSSIVNDRLLVVANSYIAAFNKNKETAAGIESTLGPVVILRYGLNNVH